MMMYFPPIANKFNFEYAGIAKMFNDPEGNINQRCIIDTFKKCSSSKFIRMLPYFDILKMTNQFSSDGKTAAAQNVAVLLDFFLDEHIVLRQMTTNCAAYRFQITAIANYHPLDPGNRPEPVARDDLCKGMIPFVEVMDRILETGGFRDTQAQHIHFL